MGSNIYIVIFVFSFVIGVIGSATIVFYILDNRQSHQFQDKTFKSSKKKKEKTTKVVRNSTYMYRELANLCEKRKKYSRNMP